MIPEIVIILLALASAYVLRPYFGGHAKAAARLWVVGFYMFLWLGPDVYNAKSMSALSRVGWALVFISDIIPVIIGSYRKYKAGKDAG